MKSITALFLSISIIFPSVQASENQSKWQSRIPHFTMPSLWSLNHAPALLTVLTVAGLYSAWRWSKGLFSWRFTPALPSDLIRTQSVATYEETEENGQRFYVVDNLDAITLDTIIKSKELIGSKELEKIVHTSAPCSVEFRSKGGKSSKGFSFKRKEADCSLEWYCEYSKEGTGIADRYCKDDKDLYMQRLNTILKSEQKRIIDTEIVNLLVPYAYYAQEVASLNKATFLNTVVYGDQRIQFLAQRAGYLQKKGNCHEDIDRVSVCADTLKVLFQKAQAKLKNQALFDFDFEQRRVQESARNLDIFSKQIKDRYERATITIESVDVQASGSRAGQNWFGYKVNLNDERDLSLYYLAGQPSFIDQLREFFSDEWKSSYIQLRIAGCENQQLIPGYLYVYLEHGLIGRMNRRDEQPASSFYSTHEMAHKSAHNNMTPEQPVIYWYKNVTHDSPDQLGIVNSLLIKTVYRTKDPQVSNFTGGDDTVKNDAAETVQNTEWIKTPEFVAVEEAIQKSVTDSVATELKQKSNVYSIDQVENQSEAQKNCVDLRMKYDAYCVALQSFKHEKTEEYTLQVKNIFDEFVELRPQLIYNAWQDKLDHEYKTQFKDKKETREQVEKFVKTQPKATLFTCMKLYNKYEELIVTAKDFYKAARKIDTTAEYDYRDTVRNLSVGMHPEIFNKIDAQVNPIDLSLSS